MNILKLITSLLLIILPLSVLIRDWKFHDRRTKKHHNITRGIIVFWFLGSIMATYFVWSDSAKIEELIDGKNTLIAKIGELKATIDKYQKENENLKLEIDKAKRGIESSFDFNGARRVKSGGRTHAIADEEFGLFKKLIKLDNERNYTEMLKLIEPQIKKTPTWFTLYYLRGIAYANIGDTNKAIIDFEDFVRKASGDISYEGAIEKTKIFIERLKPNEQNN